MSDAKGIILNQNKMYDASHSFFQSKNAFQWQYSYE